MSILNKFFGGAPAVPPNTPADGVVKPVESTTTAEVIPQALDLSTFWDKPTSKDVGKATPSPFNLDDAGLTDNFKNSDFSAIFRGDSELAAKAVSGDAAALVALLSKTAQAAAMVGMQKAVGFVSNGIEHTNKGLTEAIPGMIQHHASKNALQADPLLSDPLMRPLVETVANQILARAPTATPDDIAEGVREFFQRMANKIAPQQSQDLNKPPAAAIDFSTFFDK